MVRLAEVIAALDAAYDPALAEPWDAIGLVCGDPDEPVTSVLFAVDVTRTTVAEAIGSGAQLLVTHHPLFLHGVHGVPTTDHRGRLVHSLIRAGVALHTVHTNADAARPGVSDALADMLGLVDLRPLLPADRGPTGTGLGRVGELAAPSTVAELADRVAAALPATVAGLRVAGDLARIVRTVAVCGGAGDSLLAAAGAAGADAYLTADLRHHPVSDHLAAGGPVVLEAAHWATEWPWLPVAAGRLAREVGVRTAVSERITDPWAVHHPSGAIR
ncbi:MAG: Nif3-like dinuclear metal center hexameric protein [Actinobacteria bacterium]|nr:Nif3-like dinuclear metal center hexameric protein [Actinomycetota bacterium]MBI3686294.1 Nif3-like dinuclear metal center hexameric protein [Actinomycetota bacterium]